MIRTVITRFAFNGMPKGLRFTYDPEIDVKIVKLIETGVLEDITPVTPQTIVISMPSIESAEEIGEVNGQGPDQPSGGGGEGSAADDSAGTDGLPGDQGAVTKVAKRR